MAEAKKPIYRDKKWKIDDEAHSQHVRRGWRRRGRKNGILREAAADGRILSGGRGRESAPLYAVGNRDAVYPRARR